MIFIATGFIPLPPLPIVSTMFCEKAASGLEGILCGVLVKRTFLTSDYRESFSKITVISILYHLAKICHHTVWRKPFFAQKMAVYYGDVFMPRDMQ